MVNIPQIKRELLTKLRNEDLISKTIRGVTTVTDDFSGDNSTVSFNLTNIGVKNVRTIVVDSVPLTFGEDWDYSENRTTKVYTITFVVAPAIGVDNINITYDYTTTQDSKGKFIGDRIYSDFSQVIVNVDKFARIHFDITSSATSVKSATKNPLLQSNLVITISAYGVGKEEAESLNQSIRDFMDTEHDTMFTLNFIRELGISQMLPFEGTGNKIFFRENTYRAPFEFNKLT